MSEYINGKPESRIRNLHSLIFWTKGILRKIVNVEEHRLQIQSTSSNDRISQKRDKLVGTDIAHLLTFAFFRYLIDQFIDSESDQSDAVERRSCIQKGVHDSVTGRNTLCSLVELLYSAWTER